MAMSEQYVAAIDQGTASSRCMVFDRSARIVSVAQKEHEQLFPRPGWVEHDPEEIWRNVVEVVQGALDNASLQASDLVALGIANQRESTIVWDRETGAPVHNAINWQDTRTDAIIRQLAGDAGQDRFRERCGLPLATYFSGPKLRWLLDTVPGLRERAEAGEVLFGTMDSWLIWKLTGRHLTDVTNASRTMLMGLETLDWDDVLLDAMGVPRAMLPEIRPSSEVYGEAVGPLGGVPVASALGDQQAALFGQTCFSPGEAKCTYGTGSFLLFNTGERPVQSANGLVTTVCCRIGDEAPTYALEGSIAVTGALVQWFRDNITLIGSAPEIETLARTVEDNGGCYFVPAFSGLFAPHWRSDARGVIAGLTGYITKGHIARAVLEATAWQTREVVDAMNTDARMPLQTLRVDGGMTANNLLMQFLADVLPARVVRPIVAETVSLGAAYAAGLAVGFWSGLDELRGMDRAARRWEPAIDEASRAAGIARWHKGVERTLGWVEPEA
jgi:glycerol kinase